MNDWFIKLGQRPVAVTMAWMAALLLGLIALTQVPINLSPDRTFPGLTVRTEYNGIGPEKMEELITRPIEETIATVGGLRRIFSISEEGKSTVEIEIERGQDVDLKALEIRERIDVAAVRFPTDAQKPLVYRYDPEKSPVFIVALQSAALDQTQLRQIADRQIKKLFQSEPGASEVLVAGGQETEVLVSCDKEKLDGYGVSLNEILQLIGRNNADLSLGRIAVDAGEYPAIAVGRFRRPRAIELLPVPTQDGIFPLGQIASVEFSPRDPDSSSRLDGQERVSVYVHRAAGADLLRMSANLNGALARLRSNDWRYEVLYDEGKNVSAALWRWAAVSLAALCFAVLVSWALVGKANATLRLAGGPLIASLCAPFPFFLLSIAIDMVTLSGVTLGALFAVAISAPGGSPAALLRRGVALLGLLGSLLAPFLLLDHQIREIYGPLAAAATIVGLLATLAQITLLPILEKRFEIRSPRGISPVRLTLRRPLATFAALARRIREASSKAPPSRPIDWRLTVLFAIPLLVAAILLTARKEVYGTFQEEELNLAVEFPSGTSFGAADDTVKKIEEKLSGAPGIDQINSRVESARGTIRLVLSPDADANDSYIAALKERIGSTSPATIFFSTPGQTESLRDLTVDVYGEDLSRIEQIIKQISDQATKLSGVSEVVLHFKPPRPERALRVNREKMFAAGVSTESLGGTIRTAIQGGIASRLMGAEREYDIRIRYDEGFRRSLEALGGFGIKGADERLIAALELASMEDRETPLRIYRTNRKRSLSFSVQLREQGADATIDSLREMIGGIDLPPEYRVEFSQAVQESLQTRQRIGLLAILGFLTMTAALTIGFESTRIALRCGWIALASIVAPLSLFFGVGAAITAPNLLAMFVVASIAAGAASAPSAGSPAGGSRSRYYLVLAAFSLPLAFAAGPGGAQLRGLGLSLAPAFLTMGLLAPALLKLRAAAAADARAGLSAWWQKIVPVARIWLVACLRRLRAIVLLQRNSRLQ